MELNEDALKKDILKKDELHKEIRECIDKLTDVIEIEINEDLCNKITGINVESKNVLISQLINNIIKKFINKLTLVERSLYKIFKIAKGEIINSIIQHTKDITRNEIHILCYNKNQYARTNIIINLVIEKMTPANTTLNHTSISNIKNMWEDYKKSAHYTRKYVREEPNQATTRKFFGLFSKGGRKLTRHRHKTRKHKTRRRK